MLKCPMTLFQNLFTITPVMVELLIKNPAPYLETWLGTLPPKFNILRVTTLLECTNVDFQIDCVPFLLISQKTFVICISHVTGVTTAARRFES